MRLIKTPHLETVIEVNEEDLQKLQNQGGLWLNTPRKNGSRFYYWRIQGTWILLVENGVRDSIQKTEEKERENHVKSN